MSLIAVASLLIGPLLGLLSGGWLRAFAGLAPLVALHWLYQQAQALMLAKPGAETAQS
jgi:hypothetical protein